MTRIRLTLLAVAAGLVFTATATPAGAVSRVHADFAVRMVTSSGFGTVVLFPPQSGTFAISQTVACADAGVHVLKPKTTEEAGIRCLLMGTGTIMGNCYRMSGTLNGGFRSSSNQDYTFTGFYEVVGTEFFLAGTATKPATGQSGAVTIHGQLVPDPLVGQSCMTGTQTQWVLAGELDFAVL